MVHGHTRVGIPVDRALADLAHRPVDGAGQRDGVPVVPAVAREQAGLPCQDAGLAPRGRGIADLSVAGRAAEVAQLGGDPAVARLVVPAPRDEDRVGEDRAVPEPEAAGRAARALVVAAL